jgi:ubiquinone/menaquinone biosynthesis C-methylase UbiE
MEDPEESQRLVIKTDVAAVRHQAQLCGIGAGKRVLDVGCGSGKVTSILHETVQPNGSVVGIDFSRERIEYAREHFGNKPGIEFRVMDFTKPLGDIGQFDFIWIRFILEYFLKESFDIVRNLIPYLRSEGCLCLIDLDYNCQSHYQMPPQMEDILRKLTALMIEQYNFDPYVGRKLYSYLYDLGFRDIEVHLLPHHLIYGEVRSSDHFNWIKKLHMASVKAKDIFKSYPGGFDGYLDDFVKFFDDPRRFTYTPLMVCRGKRPFAADGSNS